MRFTLTTTNIFFQATISWKVGIQQNGQRQREDYEWSWQTFRYSKREVGKIAIFRFKTEKKTSKTEVWNGNLHNDILFNEELWSNGSSAPPPSISISYKVFGCLCVRQYHMIELIAYLENISENTLVFYSHEETYP